MKKKNKKIINLAGISLATITPLTVLTAVSCETQEKTSSIQYTNEKLANKYTVKEFEHNFCNNQEFRNKFLSTINDPKVMEDLLKLNNKHFDNVKIIKTDNNYLSLNILNRLNINFKSDFFKQNEDTTEKDDINRESENTTDPKSESD
ncbi:hypothetical protein ACJA23_02165 [Mycoplasma corogypsi]|uniref:hypothetical protein n=1 Tax=Mycoplasma corogypsi TaxID=2106 RepID=UPI00387374AA